MFLENSYSQRGGEKKKKEKLKHLKAHLSILNSRVYRVYQCTSILKVLG